MNEYYFRTDNVNNEDYTNKFPEDWLITEPELEDILHNLLDGDWNVLHTRSIVLHIPALPRNP